MGEYDEGELKKSYELLAFSFPPSRAGARGGEFKRENAGSETGCHRPN
jgi:hypothetical protein